MIRIFLLASFVAPLACGDKETPPKDDTAPARATADFALAKDPGAAMSVNEAKAAAPRDAVVVEGRIDNIVDGYVTFNLVDTSLEYCGQVTAEDCPTPWDYCCIAPDRKSAATLTVEVAGPVGEIELLEGELLVRRELGETRFLERHVVVVVHVVEPDDRVAALDQIFRDVKADEARRAGHENVH